LGNDDHLIVAIRDMAGNDVVTNMNVSNAEVVTISADVTFPGTVMIYGQTAATVANMVNPMTAKGDIIYAEDIGTPQRLPVGSPDQLLCVDQNSMPSSRSLGEAAWLGINIAGRAVQLNSDAEIPSELLPLNSMTYKGIFGSSTSSTGGDLPTSGVFDGDIVVADSDYSSTVAGKTFSTGQWAIFNGNAWDILPLVDTSSGVPAGSVIAFAGNTVPQWFLPCNGYTLSKTDYPYLFSAIGTLCNNGSETADKFSIPNYKNERRFRQASPSAGTKIAPGLPDLIGHLSNVWQRNLNPSTLASGVFGNTSFNNSDVHAGGSQYDSFNDEQFRASRDNPIYGASKTVHSPAQNVIYLIKYK
jgi:hypothetical protein